MSCIPKIAIVGLACRFPGDICSLEDYWRILKEGKDVVSEVPDTRWSKDIYGHPERSVRGRSYTWAAGLLSHVDEFDAAFFGISPREAAQMDPQQRLLLELTWEALENGGIRPDSISKSDCGVFIGFASNDYLQRRIDDLASIDAYTVMGNTASIASNRISYVFDFHGPSISIDTACSSSLVAFHQACHSLHVAESSMAIVGGVNMLLHPSNFIGFSKASMLSPTGRCRAFDATGDGFVRSEGAAILVLKPLDQAEKDGDRIHAVVISSGVNCDGRTKGIAVPSRESQGALLSSIYSNTKIDINDLAYIEAHGTGTAIGDPIETGALGDAIGGKRSYTNPLLIGSVKTNLGHLEVASGAAGLVKTLLCLKHRAVPPSLHFQKPNPSIDFEGWNLKVVDRFTPLSNTQAPLVMGVNSFGFGGVNAHVVLQEYVSPQTATRTHSETLPPLILSARKEEALRALAGNYAQFMDHDQALNYYDVAWSAVHHRQPLEQRLAVFGNTQKQIINHLRAFSRGEDSPNVVTAEGLDESSDIALVYSGNGSQWQGMGCVLLKENETFRETIKEIDCLWQQYADFSIVDELVADKENGRFHLTEVSQPALLAMQIALTRMLFGQGLKARAAFGHSVGEVAAAWASGALSLEQAVHVIYERSFAQAETQGQGRMAAVSLSIEAMLDQLKELGLNDKVFVSAINSPKAITISGALESLHIVEQAMVERSVFYKLLDLDYAFHSPYMDPLENRVRTSLHGLTPRSTDSIRFISTVIGKELDGSSLDGSYWWDNIRQPVQFFKAVTSLLNDGFRIFMEIGPHPILCGYIQQCLKEKNKTGQTIALLKREQESESSVWRALHQTYLVGCSSDREALFHEKGQFVQLPTYSWQREKYWYPLTSDGYDWVNRRRENPLLGYRLKDAESTWENRLDTLTMPWLADHTVGGAVVLPAAGYIEMALAASQSWFGGEAFEIEDLDIVSPSVLGAEKIKVLRFKFVSAEGTFTIRSRDYLDIHVSGRLLGPPSRKPPSPIDVTLLLNGAPNTFTREQHYHLAESIGLDYGPAFQGVEQVWVWPSEKIAWGKIMTPEIVQANVNQFLLHPALLDSCFQLLVDIYSEEIAQGQSEAMIPVSLGKLHFHGSGAVAWCKVEVTQQNPRSIVANFLVLDSAGQILAILKAIRFRRVKLTQTTDFEPSTFMFQTKLMPHMNPASPSPTPSYLEIPSLIGSSLPLQKESLKGKVHFQEVLPLFDVLVSAYCLEALQALGTTHSPWVLNEFVVSAGVVAEQMDLLSYMLSVLQKDSILRRIDDHQWQLIDNIELPQSDEIWRTILNDYPNYLPELTILAQCGTHLPDVLCGKALPTDLINPPKSSTLEHLFDTGPSWAMANLAALEIMRETIRQWPDNRRLRILEISGGHLEITRALLAELPPEQCDYFFVDEDENVVARGEAVLKDVSFLKCCQLKIEALPEILPEGLAFASFDVVIAANTLHRSNQLDLTLKTIRRFLTTQGLLLLQERASDRFMNMTFGLDPDWWLNHEETGEPVSRLMDSRSWCQSLLENGFTDATAVIEPEVVENQGTFVVVAKNAAPTELLERTGIAETWLLLVDASKDVLRLSEMQAETLRRQGHRVVFMQTRSETHAVSHDHVSVNLNDVANVVSVLKEIGEYHHIVHLMGLSLSQENQDVQPVDVDGQRCVTTINLLHAIDQIERTGNVSLWLVTAGGAVYQGTEEQRFVNPSDAALWGLGRVAINEYPHLTIRLLDMPPEGSMLQTAELLSSEFLYPSKEDEIVLLSSGRRVMRMRHVATQTEATHKQHPPAFCLDFRAPGSLDHLYWRALPNEPALAPDQIQIRPTVSGLNFRDVMYAMGMLSDEAVEHGFAGPTLGMEVSGIVEKVGNGVTTFKPGDAVLSFAPACFGTHVISHSHTTALMPAGWSPEEGATVPVAFFTAYYALHHLGRLQPGERVLIHGAAGGVGLAAIQYAQYVGAEIFATAGTDEKRTFVRTMGVDHVMNSRNLAFADEVRDLTGGKGVDVVLNSLAGEAIWRNLAILRPFGRFLELGKRDFYQNSKIGMRPFRNNISYFGIDADQLLVERKELAGTLFREMMELFAEKVLRPLPYRAFPASQVVDAFRYMQQSRQIGKIVVSLGEIDSLTLPPPPKLPQPELKLDSQGTYLVSGGLGGFGLKTAQWLVEKGAKHLILLGRSGTERPEAIAAIQKMETQGVTVHPYAIDVTDLAGMSELFAKLENNAPPLKGLVHAAAVIDDALIRQLDEDHFMHVFMPKAQGAWNLHRLTEKIPLDFFVVYSSMTTFLGNPGQANYVAGNTYLESLVHFRRGRGLPGLFVAWGPIDDVGFLTRHQTVKEGLEARIGSKAMPSDSAMRILEKLLGEKATGMAVIDFDWRKIQRVMPGAQAPKYEEQVRMAKFMGSGSEQNESIKSQLAALSTEKAMDLIKELLAQEVGHILRLPTDKVDTEKSVFDLGMDSLMGMELAIAIEDRFVVKLPMMALAEGGSIERIAIYVAGLLNGDGPPDVQHQYARDTIHATVAQHGDAVTEKVIDKVIQGISESNSREIS